MSASARPPPQQTWLEIDLDALAHNVSVMKQRGNGAAVAAVLKADAYGHGALPIAEAAIAAGAQRVCVYSLDEAEALRRHGFAAPILILGRTAPEDADRVVRLDVAVTVSQLDVIEALGKAAIAAGTVVLVHLKVEAGMHRLGVAREEAGGFADRIRATAGLTLEGIASHFPSPEGEATDTEERFARFLSLAEPIGAPLRHVANTATLWRFPQMALEMVRPGIGLYGVAAGGDVSAKALGLRPVMSWKALIVQVQDVPAGESVSYGATWTAARDSSVAVVAVGYADGYRRSLSNRGVMLVRGERAPVVGTVCMDMCMLDLTELRSSGAAPGIGDEVVLVGGEGSQRIDLETFAELCETIPHEVCTAIGERVARVYLRGGRPVAIRTQLDATPVPC